MGLSCEPIRVILGQRYKIVRSIKSGGMGAVYLALDQRLGDSLCAVKAMLDAVKGGAHEEIIRRKFQSEAEVLSQLQHPGIPAVRDYFVEAETAYIVMDYVEGDNLELEKGEPLTPEAVVPMALEVLEILSYLHGRPTPVIHCDIKPANIIREKASGRIKLVDFGLARSLTDEKTQTVAGTLGYSAMEQLRGHAEPRSDLYALGITMFYMLTGQLPTFLMVPPIREILPDLDPRLAAVIDSSTRMEAEQRPAGAVEMRQALLQWWAVKDRPPTPAELAAANRVAAGRLSWRRKLKVLLQKARGRPPQTPEVFDEPCPACKGPVPSDQSHCPRCRHKLDPEPLQVKTAVRQAFTFAFRQPDRLGGCLLLMLLWLACNHYAPRLVYRWPLAIQIPQVLLSLLWLGYPLAVANQRIRTGQAGLPGWGNGLLHLRRALRTLLLSLAVFGLPWAVLMPIFLMAVSVAFNGGIFFLLMALTLAVVLFVITMRQCILWPWAWSSLAERSHLPTALDLTAIVHQGGPRLQGRFALQVLLIVLWLSLALLLSSLWWPLAALPLTLGVLASADFCGSVHRAHFSRELPDWTGSYRSLLGRSWRSYDSVARGKSLILYVGLSTLVGFILTFGALVPSLDRHRYPALGSNHKIGYINRNGWMALEPQFTGAFPFTDKDEAVPARLANHWGYLRRNGSWLVQPKYEEAYPFSDGLARVKDRGLYGYIDKMGSLAVPPQYKFAREFHEGLAAASENDKVWGYIDRYGWSIRPQFFGEANPFCEGLAAVGLTDSISPRYYGYINAHGRVVHQGKFTSAGNFASGLAPVELQGSRIGEYYCTTMTHGGVKAALHYFKLAPFSEERASFSDNGGMGFIDLAGSEVVPAQFTYAGAFHEGVAWVSDGEKYGYIHKDGGVWLAPQFTQASDFVDGVALVRLGDMIGYINHQGHMFWGVYVAGGEEVLRTTFEALKPTDRPNPVYPNHLPDGR